MLEGITIEPFRPEHADAFAALNRAWLVEHELLEPADEKVLLDPWTHIIEPGGHLFIALNGSEVLGTSALIPHGEPGVFELAKLAVAPSAQGRGLGRRLVEVCLAEARREGASRVMLLSNSRLARAVALYEAMGFAHRPLPPVLPYHSADVCMELDLNTR
ncbi:MAG: GNAT family N-acetyltransferase [Gemmatimonadota bacterium]